jgi:HEAT repeat protein
MPRRRFITIVGLTAVVLACGVMAWVVANRRPPEPVFQGRSASYWLREIFGAKGRQSQAMAAFRQMGTNAEPVLVTAMAAKENLLDRMFRRMYPRLPAMIRQRFPQPADHAELRSAAGLVLMNNPFDDIVPKLLPLLATPDSGVRMAVFSAVQNRIGPTDAGQVPVVLMAANDPDLDVRMEAAVALWKITGQTNTAVPILQSILVRQADARHRHWAACYLWEMRQADPLLIPTFIDSLTNRQAGIRMSACSCLGQIGPPATAAIPALRQALQDVDSEVRRRAKSALTRIDPQHPAADSP